MQTDTTFLSLRLALLASSAGLCAFGTVAAQAGGVSAGTLIENIAIVTYDDGEATRTLTSNNSVIRVDEVLDVTVTSLNSEPVSASPGEAVLTFEVINQGNGPEAFNLVARTQVAENDFETAFVSVAIDSNGNGSYDPGVDEILTGSLTTPILAADEAVTVFVFTEVPGDVSDQQLSQVELTASAVTGDGAPGTVFAGQGAGGGDAISGTTTASASSLGSLLAGITSVSLTKSVSFVDPFGEQSAVPGTVATYTLFAEVMGSGSIDDLIIADAIPEGTTYASGTLTLDENQLTDASGDDAGDASNADGISVALGTAQSGASHTITFAVTID